MTADNYAELVARLQDLAPCVDDITGPSSVVEIAAAKALREAGDAIEALVTERDAMKNLLLVMVTTAESWMSTPEAKLMLVNGAIDAVNTQNRIDQIRAVLSEGNIND